MAIAPEIERRKAAETLKGEEGANAGNFLEGKEPITKSRNWGRRHPSHDDVTNATDASMTTLQPVLLVCHQFLKASARPALSGWRATDSCMTVSRHLSVRIQCSIRTISTQIEVTMHLEQGGFLPRTLALHSELSCLRPVGSVAVKLHARWAFATLSAWCVWDFVLEEQRCVNISSSQLLNSFMFLILPVLEQDR